jgi:hypothetical protein
MRITVILYQRCLSVGGWEFVDICPFTAIWLSYGLGRHFILNFDQLYLSQDSAMAVYSEHVDEGPHDVGALLNNLRIPSNFAQHETLEDTDAIVQLDAWKANAFGALEDLRRLLGNKLDESQKSDLIYTCAAFQGDGDWTSEDMRALSSGKRSMYATHRDMAEVLSTEILELEGEPSLFLLEEVLAKHIKPIFQTNPHPMLNAETGRKLPRAAGGYAAAQDAYEGQVWKEHPGIGNVLLWCVQRIDVRACILASAHAELHRCRPKRTNACGTSSCPR